MGRAPRPIAGCASYHLMARGNNRQPIFYSDSDRETFLRIVEKVSSARRWVHHAWCLMGNHFHLLSTTCEPDVHDGMRDICGRYSRWLGQRRSASGHTFGDRYRSVVVDSDEQFLTAVRYIANNPVRAGLVSAAIDYRWSSYGCSHSFPWFRSFDRESVLGFLHPRPEMARAQLRDLVESAEKSSRWGGEERPAIRVLIAALGRRDGICAAARIGYTHNEIAGAIGRTRSAVSQHIRKFGSSENSR